MDASIRGSRDHIPARSIIRMDRTRVAHARLPELHLMDWHDGSSAVGIPQALFILLTYFSPWQQHTVPALHSVGKKLLAKNNRLVH